MERKERKGRQKAARRFRLNELRRRARKTAVPTDSRSAAGEIIEGMHAGRARKNTTAINLTKARNAGLRVKRRRKNAAAKPPGRNMQAEKPPSRTGRVHPEPQGGEDRRPHKPRRN